MKLNYDLMREILLAIESSGHSTTTFMDVQLPGHSEEEISYHVRLLAEAGYVEALDYSSRDSLCWKPKRLTYGGHVFLETIRDSGVWSETKSIAGKIGVKTFDVFVDVAKGLIAAKIKAFTGLGAVG